MLREIREDGQQQMRVPVHSAQVYCDDRLRSRRLYQMVRIYRKCISSLKRRKSCLYLDGCINTRYRQGNP